MLKYPTMVTFDGDPVTDHSRQPMSVTTEEIKRETRMANGRARKYVVTTKRTFSTSWDLIPDSNNAAGGMTTVDLGMSGGEIENFYNNTKGPFTLRLYYGRGEFEEYQVMFTDFSKEIANRGPVDLWNISLTLEEC